VTVGSRIVLGLDPGVAAFGYGLLSVEGQKMRHLDHGCIQTPSGEALHVRLRAIDSALRSIRSQHPITDVAMEVIFHTKNVQSALSVGHARGVALVAVMDSATALGEYTPTEVKQAVAGHGGAAKQQMQDMVALILGMPVPPTPDDAADALAVAICHAQRLDLNARLAMSSSPPMAALA